MNDSTLTYASKVSAVSPMREIFGLIVRFVGLLLSLWGIYSTVYVFAFYEQTSAMRNHPTIYFAFGAIYLVVGAALLRGEWIVTIAYGRRCD